jgi:PadR family transcriptional regulator PadR
MRRRAGGLVPLEVAILEIAIELRGRGVLEVYGFQLAKAIRKTYGTRRLTAYGTLYKALDRLALAGMLTSRWEDPEPAHADGRPRRRFYKVTLTGEAALADALERPEPTSLRRSAASAGP